MSGVAFKKWARYKHGQLSSALGGGRPLPGGWTAHDKDKKEIIRGSERMREFRKDKYKFYNPGVKEAYWDSKENLIKAGVDPTLQKEEKKVAKATKKRMIKESKTPLTKAKVLMARQEGTGQTIKQTLMG
tara:strand:+ start:3320 stop:3709 length:390 start_codon:yes stop_codon:yes gene_type:complete